MSDRGGGAPAADELAELAGRVVRLAEALEAAEVEVASVRAECDRLGVTERFAEHLARLSIPSDAAEHLQDGLDQLVGELDQRPHRGAGQPGAEPLPRLSEAHPPHERLAVACSSCGAHIGGIEIADRAALEQADLDERTYDCARCGHRDAYGTWDHFVEAEAAE